MPADCISIGILHTKRMEACICRVSKWKSCSYRDLFEHFCGIFHGNLQGYYQERRIKRASKCDQAYDLAGAFVLLLSFYDQAVTECIQTVPGMVFWNFCSVVLLRKTGLEESVAVQRRQNYRRKPFYDPGFYKGPGKGSY